MKRLTIEIDIIGTPIIPDDRSFDDVHSTVQMEQAIRYMIEHEIVNGQLSDAGIDVKVEWIEEEG